MVHSWCAGVGAVVGNVNDTFILVGPSNPLGPSFHVGMKQLHCIHSVSHRVHSALRRIDFLLVTVFYSAGCPDDAILH